MFASSEWLVRMVLNIVLLFGTLGQHVAAQRDSIFGLDSTILAHYDMHISLYWPNGALRSQFQVKSDSTGSMTGFREDGERCYEAEYAIIFEEDSFVRGYQLLRYEQFYAGAEGIQVAGSITAKYDATNEFAPIQEWMTYFPNGKIQSFGQFDGWDERSGEYVEYHENGVAKWKGQYCVRMIDISEPSCPDGIKEAAYIQELWTSNQSMKCSTWENYDRCGRLLETVTYDWK